MLSGSSETIIFMFLGVATIHDDHEWNWAFICLTILFCTIFRVIGKLYPKIHMIYVIFWQLFSLSLEHKLVYYFVNFRGPHILRHRQ